MPPKIEYPFKIRIYVDKEVNPEIADSTINGIKYLLDLLKYKYSIKRYDYNKEIEPHLHKRSDGSIDVNALLDDLVEEKMKIFNDKSSDKPHWDIIITSKNLRPKGYNFVFGGASTLRPSDNVLRPDMSQIAISSYMMAGHKHAEEIAFLIGFHETAHLFYMQHCEDKNCVFYHALGGLKDLEPVIKYYIKHKKPPICSFKHFPYRIKFD